MFEPNTKFIWYGNTEYFIALNISHKDVQEHVKRYLGQDHISFCIPLTNEKNKKAASTIIRP